jgi:hypothetical protein
MKLNSKNILILSVFILLLAVSGISGFMYWQSQKKTLGAATSQVEDSKNLISEIGQFFELPTGEDPTVATITDITKLAGQDFFKHAENGDRVLIYTNARQAILYRSRIKKIIAVAPVNISDDSTPSAGLPANGQVAGAATGASFGIPSPTLTPAPVPPKPTSVGEGGSPSATLQSP